MIHSTKLSVLAFSLALVASVSVAAPANAAALTTGQIQAVVSLLQAFGVDSSTITTVESTLGGATTSASNVPSSISGNLIGFLTPGDEGDGVTLLQLLLAADSTVYPEGVVSGYFGPLTQKALRQYQRKHGLEQVGFVGPKTLKKLQEDLASNPLEIEDEDEDDDDDNASSTARIGKGRLCAKIPPGHLIAPGWLRKMGGVMPIVPTCQKLPPGIAKKIGTGTGTGTTTDTVAPVISEIDEDSIDSDSAEIEWKTNEKATSVVTFGTTTAYGSTVSQGSTRVTSHSVLLSGLMASTLYHYRITSVDAAGNSATSSDQTFTTTSSGTADTTAPTISNVTADSITTTAAEIEWDTNEDATSKVYYGTTNPLDVATASVTSVGGLDDSHDVDLAGLTASTTYYYVVVSADAAGNTATSSQSSFSTLAS